MTLGNDLAEVFSRELTRLAEEVEAYTDEGDLWKTFGDQKNPPGVLAQHLTGNLLAYIGASLGNTGYVRDRDAEFGDRRPRSVILAEIEVCREMIEDVLPKVSDEVMTGVYPGTPPARMPGIGTHAFLVHLLWHFGWHLGQIYYHRLSIE